MRDILAEAHAIVGPRQNGPFYVTYIRGDFTLYPFGSHARGRYIYRVLPLFIRPGNPWPQWVFEVLGVME